jgi:ribosomal protein L11 methyltransferase
MSFTLLKVHTPKPEFVEILQAELSMLNFDVFLDTKSGFETSVESIFFHREEVIEVLKSYQEAMSIRYEIEEVEKQNWNEIWEKNFEPIVVADRCLIRAEFHKIAQQYDYELVITPKMSFGTGHHATTALMVALLLETDFQDKTVLDCGCGTGILAILALKRGAKSALGCDIEDWSVESAIENTQLNNTPMTVIEGTAQTVKGLNLLPFDVVMANIQLNVLLEEMPIYADLCAKNGLLLLSGIHTPYIDQLSQKAADYGFVLKNSKEQDTWAALCLQKVL